MNKCPAAWNLNKMGQAAAVAALADQAFSTESKGKIVESRHWLTEQMQKLAVLFTRRRQTSSTFPPLSTPLSSSRRCRIRMES